MKYLLGCFIALLFTASYCVRTAETPVNTFHAGLFGNQLWLTIVTVRLVIVHINISLIQLWLVIVHVIMYEYFLILSRHADDDNWIRRQRAFYDVREICVCSCDAAGDHTRVHDDGSLH